MFLFLFLASAYAFNAPITQDVRQQFVEFKALYNKTYSHDEERIKLKVFAENLVRVDIQNKEHVAIGGEEVFGITKFMDLTPEEFAATYLTATANNIPDELRVVPNVNHVEDDVDWRTKGCITPVKDQGQCGSCWAFSAVDAIESFGMLNGSYSLTELSTQQVNACDKVDGGCNGGNTESAYQYVHKAGGIETEKDYPYTSGGGRTGICKFKAADIAEKITGFKSIAKGEDNVQKGMALGPLSVCVAANAFQTYNRGILKRCPGSIDHCVQAVGYHTESSEADSYWIVRNSWAEDWGEKGYIRLEMGKNICKIGNDATYPTF